MLLNCARNRMSGPRFLPSGRRFGPYFWSRLEASAVSRPIFMLVVSRFIASSADIACQVGAVPPGLALGAVLILFTPRGLIGLARPTRGGASLSNANTCAVKDPGAYYA